MALLNMLKTGILLTALTLLLIAIGNMLGGQTGLLIALVLAAVMNLGAYWFSDKLVLAMSGAQPISEQEAPELYAMVRRLCQRANLPMPRLYLIPEEQPNAFATGRDPHHAAVGITQGLLRLMDRQEVEGVVAHELAHIKNRDTLIMAVAATIAGAISYLAHMFYYASLFAGSRDERGGNPIAALAMLILAPIAATIIQLAISRSREYEADRVGAEIAGTPIGLANALRKLELAAQRIPMHHAEPATAHMYIVNPLSGGGLMALFSTHPPVKERIRRLEAMARQQGAIL
ncbi:Heat shock protein. Metallo peptidase. MEROPS family M48B [Armatimonadetes bacterium GBS]|jgi:heat shock protein HtpX|nr:MAG: protease HtpX [Fimbriimonadales bacterium]CUU11027.1 Heat shock protein. Metallo peptidase. MEROPS family M48B [Armatimonadetes bacterium GBS]